MQTTCNRSTTSISRCLPRPFSTCHHHHQQQHAISSLHIWGSFSKVRDFIRGPDDRLLPRHFPLFTQSSSPSPLSPHSQPLILSNNNNKLLTNNSTLLSVGSSHMAILASPSSPSPSSSSNNSNSNNSTNLFVCGENVLGQCAHASQVDLLDHFSRVNRFATRDDYRDAKLLDESPLIFDENGSMILDGSDNGGDGMFRSVHCGKDFTIAVSNNGTDVYSTGCNDSGQLGIGYSKNRFKMYRVPLPPPHVDAKSVSGDEQVVKRRIKQVACGAQHAIILFENGEMCGFGSNAFGQLSIDSSFNQLRPKPIPRITDLETGEFVEDVKCGLGHSLFLTNRGRLYVVGRGYEGQLGIDQKQVVRPILIDSVCAKGRVTHISCGFTHSLAVVEEGDRASVYVWGSGIREAAIAWGGGHATVGRHNKTGNEHEPRLYLQLDKSSIANDGLLVASGAYHSILHTKNDGLFTAGYGTDGQIGNGKRKTEHSFVNITKFYEDAGGISRNIVSVKGGFSSSVVLSHDTTQQNAV